MVRKKLFTSLVFFTGSLLISMTCGAAAPEGGGGPAMVEKNLFSQDRKPPSPEAAVAPNQPAKPGMPITNLQLDGVIISGGVKKALIRMKSAPSTADKKKGQIPYVTARENQQVGDYRVVRIEPKSISLEKDGQTFVLSLFADGKVVIPAAPAPAAVQPQQGPGAPGVQQGQQPGVDQQRTQRVQPGPGMPPIPGNPPEEVIDPSQLPQPPAMSANVGPGEMPEPPAPEQAPPPEEPQ